MSKNLVFDSSKFENLVSVYGIKQAWINLLATNIACAQKRFAYILKDEIFSSYEILDSDYLAGLSIGDISVLYEYCVALVDSDSRRDNGQYFTPDDVAHLMVNQTYLFPKGKWLDPCSGIGNLSWHLVNAQSNKEEFLINQMILSDKDELALIIARVLFTLTFQKNRSNFFHDINRSFITYDFLSQVYSKVSSQTPDIPPHDYVIVNPPYLGLRGEDSRFETSKSRDLYAYFLENIINSSEGFVSITPQSFTNASKFQSLRKLLLKKYPMIKIYAFDNIPGNIFYGVKFASRNSNSANSMRPAIMVAGGGDSGRQITSLLRWKSGEREKLFENLDLFLSSPEFTENFFPKVSSIFLDLYDEVKKNPQLRAIVTKNKTKYPLYIPSSPRYFISALKKPVTRASMKTLYFNSAEDLDKAYLLLNSSFMYWWWRVRDGGMTL